MNALKIAEALKDKFSITNRDASFFEPSSYATERQIADVIHPLFEDWIGERMKNVKPVCPTCLAEMKEGWHDGLGCFTYWRCPECD